MTAFRSGARVHLKGHAHTPATTGTVITETLTTAHVRWDDNQAITSHLPHVLEPLGEPMSTTFKSAVSHREVRIWPANAGFAISVLDDVLNDSMSTQLAPSEAPALALAILEAAGFEADIDDASSLVNSAMGRLAMHVATDATKAKEAADREALDAEALHLCRIMWDNPDQAWTPMSPQAKAKWLKMARTARELHGVTK